MKTNSVVLVAVVAAGVMATTLVALWPARVGAAGQAPPVGVGKLLVPTLKVNGCELRPRAISGKDSTPELELTAINPTDKPVHIELMAVLMSQPPVSPMSRMPAVPRQVWQQSLPVSLVPGETRVIIVETGKKVVAGQQVHFRLVSGKSVVTTHPLTSVPLKAKTPAVTARKAPAVNGATPAKQQ